MDSISPAMLKRLSVQTPDTDNQPREHPGREPFMLRLLQAARRWRWILVGGVVGGLVIGLVATLMMTRLYASTTRLEISREAARVTKIDSVERETSIGDQEFYQTQYGLLVASGLAERVARELQLVDDPAFFKMFGMEAAYARHSQIPGDPAERAKRNEIAGRVLLDHVGIAPVRGSSLVDISALAPDPALAQKIAQTWARDFIDSNLERRYAASDYARKFLEGRIEELRQKLEDSERKAVGYAGSQGIINLPAPGGDGDKSGNGGDRSLLSDELATLGGELTVATGDRITAQARMDASRRADATTESIASPALGQISAKRAEAASDYARLSAQFGPQLPQVQAAADALHQLDRAVAAETERMHVTLAQNLVAANRREAGLRDQVTRLKASFTDLRARSIHYAIYQRDVDTNRQLYDALLQRYKEIGVAGGVESNNIAIIDAAKTADRPARPNLLINLVLGALAGGILAAAVAAALSQIDQGVDDPAKVPGLLGLPLLGWIPVSKEAPQDALRSMRSSLADAYFAVQANLALSGPDGLPRAMAITSTRAQEGKSTTALALAQAIARTGSSVVLVDADMRSPSVHKLFGVQNRRGLSQILANDGTLDEMLVPSGVNGLMLLPAGTTPPNAASLLIGDRLHSVVQMLKARFDHVIIDCPPVLGLADAPLIAVAVDAVAFVVEARALRAGAVRSALDRLSMTRVSVPGVVLTKFAPHNQSNLDAYGYNYGEP